MLKDDKMNSTMTLDPKNNPKMDPKHHEKHDKKDDKKHDEKMEHHKDMKDDHKDDKKDHDKKDKDHKDGEIRGDLTFDDKVIQKIVGIALDEVDGLLEVQSGFFQNIAEKLVNTDNVTSGINVEVGKKQVAVDLDIVAEYSENIPDIYDKMKEVIEKEVKQMTDLDLVELNVNVLDVKTKEQHEKDSESVQDKLSDATSKAGDFISEKTEDLKDGAKKATDKGKEAVNKGKEAVEERLESDEPRVE